ncbi:MAG: endonuclease/exonuclease/phosphatase family protein, partial [Myxococcales bacterium]|nr:endonuclease/exonuclease/phosphatase family protein [Myxococcales bacterium]
ADDAADGLDGEDADAGDVSEPSSFIVRVVSSNLTTGNFQRYEAPGIRILMGLHADVVLMQEMKYQNEGTFRFGDVAGFVAGTFGPEFDYVVGDGSLPNGVVSRFPILESGTWDDTSIPDRGYTWARIDVPGPIDLWAVSVHLKASSSDASQRVGEANELLAYLAANVPAADYVVLGGDFNTYSRGEGAVVALGAYFATGAPWPVDNLGNDGTSTNRDHPYDWVLPDEDLAPLAIPTVVGTSTWPDGVVVDTRVYTPLSDLAPALAGDSGAASMQHMAVVRDFEIACPCGRAPDGALECAACPSR